MYTDMRIDFSRFVEGTVEVQQRLAEGCSFTEITSKLVMECLERLCEWEQISTLVLLLTAFGILVHRYTRGDQDIVLCVSVVPKQAGLPLSDHKAEPSWIRQIAISLHDQLSLHQAFQQVSLVVAEAFADITLPTGLNGDAGGSSVTVEWRQSSGEHDSVLSVCLQSCGDLVAHFHYQHLLSLSDPVLRTGSHWQMLLAHLDGNLNTPISRLPLLEDEEEHLVLREWRGNTHSSVVPQQECLHHFFEAQATSHPERIALSSAGQEISYGELDQQANQLARYLRAKGIGRGSFVAMMLPRSTEVYLSILAILKAGAAYVPIDPECPPDRVDYILQDCQVAALLTTSELAETLSSPTCPMLQLDREWSAVSCELPKKPEETEVEAHDVAYVIYTSGSTGRPKGAQIEHRSVCNLVRSERAIFQVQPQDRVYQGFSIAFDASVEEIWLAFSAGATLVVGTQEMVHAGPALSRILTEHQVSVLSCVPTLLSLLDEDIPTIRLLILGGEACPQDLVSRWWRKGRRVVNTYGPTEATVIATYSDCHPYDKVTIGKPIPNYAVYILDAHLQPVPIGVAGELHIGGVCLSRGYVNQPELTREKFIPNPYASDPGAPSHLYKTGDLVRFTANGAIEFLGRIDAQVKLRGFRVELTEIESVLLQVPGIAQAVVNTYEPEPGVVELVAYYSRRKGTARIDQEQAYAQLRGRLPGYMIPAYLEELAVIPMLPSNKADRKNLPAPKGPRSLATQHSYVGPTTETEQVLANALAHTMRLERVSIDSHFFDDLGANSLLMARFCARVRARADMPAVAMQDVYLHPTIRSLAVALEDVTPAPAAAQVPASREARTPASTWQYVLCGTLQLLLFLGYLYLIALVMVGGFEWITSGTASLDISVRSFWISSSTDWFDIYVRAFIFGGASLLGLCTAPIVAKWLLVGRWKPQEIPIWSLDYVRFWAVKTLIRLNPLVLFVGSPLYVLYLKALGARIGRGVAIFSQHIPVCTDLLTIGDGTVIRKDSFFTCYRAHAGQIQTGPVTLGKDVFVGEKTVIDIDTSLGDGAQLGHTSALHAGQAVPDGQQWHGSPAQRTDVGYRAVAPTTCGTLRRVSYSALQLLSVLILSGLVSGTAVMLLPEVTLLSGLQDSASLAITSWTFYRDVLAISFVLFFGAVLVGLALVVTVPRVLNLALKPDKVYPLYGFHYWLQQTIARMTNLEFFVNLFGDSSYIVHYLRTLGYNLSRIVQTGTNFGAEMKHETPYLVSIGTETMVSDGLSIINANFSSTSFCVSRVSIGPRNFLGTNITYPAGGRTGDNCLLATKAMVPLDGDIREGVGLLGSPCFEIPRSVQYDSRFDYLKSEEELRRRLAAKNKHNIATMGLFLLVHWFQFFGVILLALVDADLSQRFGGVMFATALALFLVLALVFIVSSSVLVERAITGFRALRPQYCSIYEPYFWWHERLWKLVAHPIFNGTPFKNVLWRLLGVRLGRRVFDDGCGIPEKTLVTIGNDCTLNAGSIIQCHSMEEGIFKSDHTTLGAGCTLGINALVHYGVTMGDGAVLDADSFLMKGEEIGPHARWRGNPAREMRDVLPVGATVVALRPEMALTVV